VSKGLIYMGITRKLKRKQLLRMTKVAAKLAVAQDSVKHSRYAQQMGLV
jgi:hypothetical protein